MKYIVKLTPKPNQQDLYKVFYLTLTFSGYSKRIHINEVSLIQCTKHKKPKIT